MLWSTSSSRPALLGVVRVHLRLVPRDLARRRRVLVLVDHPEGVAELVAHDPLVLPGRGVGLEPAVVHRRPSCVGTVSASVPTVDHEKPFSAKLIRSSAAVPATKSQREVGDVLPLLGDRGDLLLHVGDAVEEADAQAASVLPQLEPLHRRPGPSGAGARQRRDPDVVDPLADRRFLARRVVGGIDGPARGLDVADPEFPTASPIAWQRMTAAQANGITIEYDVHGDGEPLLLVMGLGGQLVGWPIEFVRSARRSGLQGDPVRQPRHRAVVEDADPAADAPPAASPPC